MASRNPQAKIGKNAQTSKRKSKKVNSFMHKEVEVCRFYRYVKGFVNLEDSEKVQSHHITEAIGYRSLDRGDWAERGI